MKYFMKYIVLLGFSLNIAMVCAETIEELPEEIREAYKQAMEAHNPYPGSHPGINIWPLERIAKSDPDIKKTVRKNKGLLETHSHEQDVQLEQRIAGLIDMQEIGPQHIEDFDDVTDPRYSTHIKSSPQKVGIAFNFHGIPGVDPKNVIGYAAANSYSQDKGWTGIGEFFTDPKLGVCNYEVIFIERVILPKEKFQTRINNKYAQKKMMGRPDVGFLYTVRWYSPEPTRQEFLECTHPEHRPGILDEMIKLAKKADASFDALNPPENVHEKTAHKSAS